MPEDLHGSRIHHLPTISHTLLLHVVFTRRIFELFILECLTTHVYMAEERLTPIRTDSSLMALGTTIISIVHLTNIWRAAGSFLSTTTSYMSWRRTPPIMNSSRPRTSVEASRKSRHTSRTQPEPVTTSFSSHVSSGMIQPTYTLASGSPDFYLGDNHCWSMPHDSFYPGNDSAHIPTLSVAPTELTHQPYWDGMTTLDSSSASSGSASNSCVSPLSTEADIAFDVYPVEHYEYFNDRYMPDVLTPPEDPPMFEMYSNNKNDYLPFGAYPDSRNSEPETECELLGPSKLQFADPRLIPPSP